MHTQKIAYFKPNGYNSHSKETTTGKCKRNTKMRPDEPLTAGEALTLILIFALVWLIHYHEDIKPEKEFDKAQTKKVLDIAHKNAVMSVDTINFDEYIVDTKAECKDSLRSTKEMATWVNHQGKNPRFADYKYIYDTLYTKQGQIKGYRLSKNMWHLNTNKAMTDPEYTKIYDEYSDAIVKLEIARRQQKHK